VRLGILRVLAGVGEPAGEREVIVSVPREMKLATARLLDETEALALRPEP
jgi:hypothetical protein